MHTTRDRLVALYSLSGDSCVVYVPSHAHTHTCHTDDHSRVVLSLQDSTPGSDYINGSYVDVSNQFTNYWILPYSSSYNIVSFESFSDFVYYITYITIIQPPPHTPTHYTHTHTGLQPLQRVHSHSGTYSLNLP